MGLRTLRAYWDYDNGWTVDTPIALSIVQATFVVNWIKKVQTGRLVGRPREVREQMENALKALTPRTLKQNLMGKGEKTLYGVD